MKYKIENIGAKFSTEDIINLENNKILVGKHSAAEKGIILVSKIG